MPQIIYRDFSAFYVSYPRPKLLSLIFQCDVLSAVFRGR